MDASSNEDRAFVADATEPSSTVSAVPASIPCAWPDVITPELADILGRPCFMFIKHAQAFRAAGFKIEKQAEAEQAFFLHRFLGHWFRHGEAWLDAADADMKEVYAQAIEARRAATLGAVHESAVPTGCAQTSHD